MEPNNLRDPPVRVDEVFNLEIEGIAEKGDGVAKIEGYVIFISGTQIGDKVTCKITKVLPKFAFAEIIEKN